ncbi:MAG: bifunctional oligoribonuclease/PAP phosphatase NrnA [Bacteroidales bacterium]|nr:bifunctional oligoribonuclease/PAP phosphatase NrnA [Bacteroidales bacterium]MDD2424695.1 bifunctional oligoribonuclease/PAP phosphatase NrnA [Bacteroidales bacterium]MDD3989857.1 bifunctional oligoribonuclease/PAP phosphatase NrnA [Bacteroidales bacterium]MDD4639713.1 bifunctional oligoribonuclease/PAP phosphatase NrnA [Bacteroidales bacterium]
MEFSFSAASIRKLYGLLYKSNNILIISHTNPDGDAIGSVKAIKGYLSSKGYNASIAIPNDCPDYLCFMDPDREIMVWNKEPERVNSFIRSSDLIILADFNSLSRIDDMESEVKASSACKILLDHHPSYENGSFDMVFSQPALSSTCELLYWLFAGLDKYERRDRGLKRSIPLSPETCESLYIGLMTDTNNFSNSVIPSTFKMASDLLAMGVDKERLQHLVFGGFSENRMRLMGHLLLNKMVVLPEYQAGYILLSLQEQKKFGFTDGDSEGFVNMPLNIKGINISALFTENESNIRVSLRSLNNFSVNNLAKRFFNGGGHEKAAGGKLFISLNDIPEYFKTSLKKSLECENK